VATRRTLIATTAGLWAASALTGSAFARPRHVGAHAKATAKAAKSGGDDDDADSGPDAQAAGGAPAQTPIGPLDVNAKWAIITDYNTGGVLLSKDADARIPPSSLTKLMTAYLTFAMLHQGRLRLDQGLPVSEKAWRMQGSKMFVPLGEQVPVEQLIQGMVIQSGNDACIVLAEGIAGSEDQFVALMNDEARKMGLSNTNFRNCTGWPDPQHYMSVRDIATLARHIIGDYPEYYHFFSERSFKFNNIDQGNRNVLVDKGLADGLKTGHTEAGGFGLCASSDHGGHRVIVVLNGMPSSKVRVQEGERLMEWAFANFELATVLKAGTVVEEAPVWLGTDKTVGLTVASDLVMTLPTGWRSRLHAHATYDAPVPAPIRRGQPIGQLVLSGDGFAGATVPLVAGNSVERLALPARAMAALGHLVGAS
jgi:serine-type D-Ala-D-Ala carboxypeptidase (penicillin-binding protein 5/6)